MEKSYSGEERERVRLYEENVDPPLVAFNLPCLSKPRWPG